MTVSDFELFVRTRGPRLLRVAHLLAGDRHRGEDLLQDVLVKTYARWSRIRGDPDAYVRQGLFNAGRTHWRRRKREEPRAELPERATHDPDLERIDQVARALKALTKRERQVLVLRYWGDLTEQQTAVELGLALGTVKSTSHRALSKLRASPHLRPESLHDQ